MSAAGTEDVNETDVLWCLCACGYCVALEYDPNPSNRLLFHGDIQVFAMS